MSSEIEKKSYQVGMSSERQEADRRMGFSMTNWNTMLNSLSPEQLRTLADSRTSDLWMTELNQMYRLNEGMNPQEEELTYQIAWQIHVDKPQTYLEGEHIVDGVISSRPAILELSPLVQKAAVLILVAFLSLQTALWSKEAHAATPVPTATMTPQPDTTPVENEAVDEVKLPTVTPLPIPVATPTQTATPAPGTENDGVVSPVTEEKNEQEISVGDTIEIKAINFHPHAAPSDEAKILTEVIIPRGTEVVVIQKRGEFILAKIGETHYWLHLSTLMQEPSKEEMALEELGVTYTVRILSDNTNIRLLPTTQSEVVHVATKNEVYSIPEEFIDTEKKQRKQYVDSSGYSWYKIILPSAKVQEGYVRSDLVEYQETTPTVVTEGVGGPLISEELAKVTPEEVTASLLTEVSNSLKFRIEDEYDLESTLEFSADGQKQLLLWLAESFSKSEVLSTTMGDSPQEVLEYLIKNEGSLPKSFKKITQLPALSATGSPFHDRVKFADIHYSKENGTATAFNITVRVLWNDEFLRSRYQISDLMWSGNEPGYDGGNLIVDEEGNISIVVVIKRRDVYSDISILETAINRGIWRSVAMYGWYDGDEYSGGDELALIGAFKESQVKNSEFKTSAAVKIQ